MGTKILNEETRSCCYWHWTDEALGQLATVTRFVLVWTSWLALDTLLNILLFSFSVSMMLEDTKLTSKRCLFATALRNRL